MNKKIKKILNKKNKSKIVCLTAYSKNIASILDKHCDIILVGDSLANVLYGMKNTHQITLWSMIEHAKSVKLGVKKSLLVVDMPKNTYSNSKLALKNAKKILKTTKCDAVKIENNRKNFTIIKKLTSSGIPVMGHIGFTPQYINKFKPVTYSKKDEKKLMDDAFKIQKAGAFSMVIECVSAKISKKVTESLEIPTIGIGASKFCDGQILVTDDLLGLSGFYPKFVKKYTNLKKIIEISIQKYRKDVLKKKFPNKGNSF